MATNLREFFSSISENIELGEDFDINEIPEVALPEAYNESFHSQFLTTTSAKNNPEVMKHYRGKYLNTADSSLKRAYLENGGTEEKFNELKGQEPDSMKLIDLVIGNISELKSSTNAPSSNDELEAYKTQTAKQISELLETNSTWEDKLADSLSENNKNWSGKLKKSMINANLNSKSFNDSMSKEDSVFLTMRKIENSPYELRLDGDLKQSVINKETGMEAIVDGKNVDWDFVLDKYSYDYTKKNDQVSKPNQPREVAVPTSSSSEDGRYITGHKDYGKP